MFSNVNEFRELALYYQKHEQYPYMDEYGDVLAYLNRGKKDKDPIIYPTLNDMSYNAQEFALHWIDLFVNGHQIGNTKLIGEHMFYLNVCRIDRNVATYGTIHKARTVVERKPEFPDFWDEDFKYYTTCDIARYGTTIEEYERICKDNLDLNLIVTEDNLSGGLNHLWGKPRGVGASWKGGSTANYNQVLVPNSNTFIFAETDQYLGGKDGFFTKFTKLRSFIQKEVWFLRKDFLNQNISNYLYRTGYKESVGGGIVESGFLSTVAGVVVDGDSEKGRGKRGNAIFEEFGSFPTVEDTWLKYHASMNEYGNVFGHARGFGTGGDTKTATVSGMNALNRMFNDPKAYNLLEFKNVYEETERSCAMFTPAFINITDKDKEGNSIKEIAVVKQTKLREQWKKAADPTLYDKNCAEFPWKPTEMFALAGHNIFPIHTIREHYESLEKNGIHKTLVTNGWLVPTLKGLKFEPTDDLQYEAFPVKAGDKKSCISIYQAPHKVYNKVPDGLYQIWVDPYGQDESQGNSIGSVYVYELPNNITNSGGDLIVAWYNARPEGHNGLDTFSENLFYLAEYYNASVGLESDRAEAVIQYAKTHRDTNQRKLTLYLHDQFELAHDEKLKTKKTMNRAFGMHMTQTRISYADKYLQQWLLTPVLKNNETGTLLNLHMIYDLGLLRELMLYDGNNADRISACRVGMYQQREFETKQFRKPKERNNLAFFNKTLFQ